MAEYALHETLPLGGYARAWGETRLEEVGGRALVSLAVPRDGEAAFAAALQAATGLAPPGPGESAAASGGTRMILWLSPGLYLLSLPAAEDVLAEPGLSRAMGAAAYVTEQSDAWCILRLAGSLARPALERICPIDLHPDVFPPGRQARTLMEHLGAIVLAEARDRFLLLAAASSAKSFLHAVETSLDNVG